MSINNGNVGTAADLNAQITAALAAMQADNAQLPGALELNFFFHNLVAGTLPALAKAVFVVPFDCYLESLAVQAGDFTAASTVTAALTSDGVGVNWPVTRTGSVGAGINKLARLLHDNTKTSHINFATVSQGLRVFPKFSTCTLQMSTTNVATPSALQVCLCMREFFARE